MYVACVEIISVVIQVGMQPEPVGYLDGAGRQSTVCDEVCTRMCVRLCRETEGVLLPLSNGIPFVAANAKIAMSSIGTGLVGCLEVAS